MTSREPLTYFKTQNYFEMVFNKFRMNYEEEFKRIFYQAKSEALNSIQKFDLSDVKMRAHIKFVLNNMQSYYLELYDDYISNSLTFDQRCEAILEVMLNQLSNSNHYTERYPLFTVFKINLEQGILIDYLNSEINKLNFTNHDLQLKGSTIIESKNKDQSSFAKWFTDDKFSFHFLEQLKKFCYLKDSKWVGLPSDIPMNIEIPAVLLTLKINKKLSSKRNTGNINLKLLLEDFNESFQTKISKNHIYDFATRLNNDELTELDQKCLNQLEDFFKAVELNKQINVNN